MKTGVGIRCLPASMEVGENALWSPYLPRLGPAPEKFRQLPGVPGHSEGQARWPWLATEQHGLGIDS